MMKRKLASVLLLVALSFGSVSCVRLPESRPIKPIYYHLEAIEGKPAGPDGDFLEGSWFYVRPVELAPYLDDSRLVARRQANEVEFFDQHRWSENLEDSLARVLGKNLSSIFGTHNYSTHPHLKRAAHDFEIGLAVHRFEWIADEQVILAGTWRLFREGKQVHVAPLQEIVTVESPPSQVENEEKDVPRKLSAQVQALGKAMRRASERIAAEVVRRSAVTRE